VIEEQLLILLRSRANPRGVVTLREQTLVHDSGLAVDALRTALAQLTRAGFLEVLAPLPFLVCRMRPWSGSIEESPNSAPVAYSYSFPINDVQNSYRRPEHTLLQEILETLGEKDPSSFEGALTHYAPDVIRKALDRVRRAKSVRKNRTALFRYLLTKLSK